MKERKPSQRRVFAIGLLGFGLSAVAMVVIVAGVVMIMIVLWGNCGFAARFSQKLGYFAIATLNVDGLAIILQSARSCTVWAVGKSGGAVNGQFYGF